MKVFALICGSAILKAPFAKSERLLSYGEPQGEADLRQVLADYIRQRRNVNCSADDIVIGAGVQSLLNILCPLIRHKKTVSFPNASFVQGSTIFADYDFDVRYRNKNCDVIYVSPAHMTKWGKSCRSAVVWNWCIMLPKKAV